MEGLLTVLVWLRVGSGSSCQEICICEQLWMGVAHMGRTVWRNFNWSELARIIGGIRTMVTALLAFVMWVLLLIIILFIELRLATLTLLMLGMLMFWVLVWVVVILLLIVSTISGLVLVLMIRVMLLLSPQTILCNEDIVVAIGTSLLLSLHWAAKSARPLSFDVTCIWSWSSIDKGIRLWGINLFIKVFFGVVSALGSWYGSRMASFGGTVRALSSSSLWTCLCVGSEVGNFNAFVIGGVVLGVKSFWMPLLGRKVGWVLIFLVEGHFSSSTKGSWDFYTFKIFGSFGLGLIIGADKFILFTLLSASKGRMILIGSKLLILLLRIEILLLLVVLVLRHGSMLLLIVLLVLLWIEMLLLRIMLMLLFDIMLLLWIKMLLLRIMLLLLIKIFLLGIMLLLWGILVLLIKMLLMRIMLLLGIMLLLLDITLLLWIQMLLMLLAMLFSALNVLLLLITQILMLLLLLISGLLVILSSILLISSLLVIRLLCTISTSNIAILILLLIRTLWSWSASLNLMPLSWILGLLLSLNFLGITIHKGITGLTSRCIQSSLLDLILSLEISNTATWLHRVKCGNLGLISIKFSSFPRISLLITAELLISIHWQVISVLRSVIWDRRNL